MSNNEGNPEIGMKENSLDEIGSRAEDYGTPDGSSPFKDNFFEHLENDVNGVISDTNPNEVTQGQIGGSEQLTHTQTAGGSNSAGQGQSSNSWEKRYKDSSREAVKLKEQINELKPFIPVLDAMKKDSGLVDHVREYLLGGGKPAQSVQEQLGLSEDFVYDGHEARQDPDSDSAKVLNAHVDKMVQKRVGAMISAEKQNAEKVQKGIEMKKKEEEFRTRNNMTPEQYEGFKAKAKEHMLTLDDIHYLLNRDKVAANTANATRSDMLTQMKNVREVPTSASGANSQGQSQSPESSLFDSLLGFDDDVDNLFG